MQNHLFSPDLPSSTPTAPPCPVRVGTCGFSYAEWAEAGFYPPGSRQGYMLGSYSQRFSATELNFTWYQLPKAAAIVRMQKQVPRSFRFAAKLTRTMTHEVDPTRWRTQMEQYKDGLSPLLLTGQLLAVLIQLPPYFNHTPKNRRYLAELLDELHELPTVVEFRNASWATDRVFAELEKRRVTLAAVDEPELPGLFPRLDVITNREMFYIRFHGRNNKGWRSGNMQKQFDYDYSDEELAEWVENRIVKMARKTRGGAIFFNNHVRAQAPKNAEQLIALLTERGILEKQWKEASST